MKDPVYTKPGFVKLTALVKYSGLSRRTLWTLIKQGLPYFQKTGPTGRPGNIMVKISDFDSYMEKYRLVRDPRRIAEEMLE